MSGHARMYLPDYHYHLVQPENNYTKAPLNHDKLSVRLFNEIHNNGLNAIVSASALDIPFLIAHGDADAITSAKASEEFANACPIAMLKTWPGLRHETHNEQIRMK